MDKGRHLRKNDTSSDYTIIKSSGGEPDQTVINDNVKIWSFLNPYPDSSKKIYTRVIRKFFSYYAGLKISDIKSHHIESYIADIYKNASPSTINVQKSALSSLFKFLAKDCYITSDPTLFLRRVKVDRTRFLNRVPEKEEIRRLIEVCENDRDKLIIEFLYVTGLRASEALSLTFDGFKTPSKGKVLFTFIGKGSKTRVGSIPETLFNRLIELEGYSLKAPLFRKMRGNKEEGITYIALYYLLKNISIKAKLGYVASPHKFRHSHGTHAYRNGDDLRKIKDRLGHVSLNTTDIYMTTDADNLSEVFLNDYDV